MKNWISYISTAKRPLAPKLCQGVTYYEKLSPINLYNPLSKLSRESDDRLKTFYHHY